MLVPLWKSTARCPTLFLAVPFALPTPSLWREVLTAGQWGSLDQPHIFAQGGMEVAEYGLFPPGSNIQVGVGDVSLQPPACSRWTRVPARITSYSGTTTQNQTPAGPSSSADAEGTATASKPSGDVSGGAKPQQVRQPLSPPTLLFLQPGVRSKQENPPVICQPPLTYGAPSGPKEDLEVCL